jgi:hypothetical protein
MIRKQTIAPTAIRGVEVVLFPPPPPPPPLLDPRGVKWASVFIDLDGDNSWRVVEAVAAGESEIGDIVFVFGDALGGCNIFLNSDGYDC